MSEVPPEGSMRLERTPTPTITVDDIVEDALGKDQSKTICQMKVDIEGCEYEALIGANLEQVVNIAVEFHPSDAGDVGMLVEYLLQTHSINMFGHPRVGGMIYARRYGS